MARAVASVGVVAVLATIAWMMFRDRTVDSPTKAVVDPPSPLVLAPVSLGSVGPATRPSEPPPAPRSTESRPVTRVAPGTPARFLRPYIQGYVPVEILEDGTQVYENMPCKVKQADGTMKEQTCSIRVNPMKPAPIAPEDR